MADSCHKIMLDAAAGRLSDDEIEEIAVALDAARRRAHADSGLEGIEAALQRARDDGVKATEAAAAIAKRNAYINIIREEGIMARTRVAFQKTKDLTAGLKSALVGIHEPFEGSSRSVDGLTQAISQSWFGNFHARLKQDGVIQQWLHMKGDFELEVVKAVSWHNTPAATRGSLNVSADAKLIGKAMHDYQEKMLGRLNRAGANISKRDGYVIRQQHDIWRMDKAGPDKWKDAIRGELDYTKMGISNDRIEDFLDSTYDAIVTGVRKEKGAAIEPISGAFRGPGNLAKSLSHSRLLEFKDASGWHNYDQAFGHKSLAEGFSKDIMASGRAVALMDVLGTNPEAMVDRVSDRIRKEYRGDRDAVKKFESDSGWYTIEGSLANVTGDVHIGSQTKVAHVGYIIRALQTLAKLGGAVLSAPTDLSLIASTRRYQGRSMMDAWGDSFTAGAKGLKGGEARLYSDMMGVGNETLAGGIVARFSSDDNIPGNMAKMVNTFFKLNLLGPWTDAHKRGVTMMISHDIANEASKAFSDLPSDMRRLLDIYGIDEKQWKVGRQAVRTAEDGRIYLLPGDVDDVSGSVFTGLSKAKQSALKDQTRENFSALLVNEADNAVVTPGAKEQAIMNRGYRPDSTAGQAVRFFGQFKSFPLTVMSKSFGRQIHGYGGTGSATRKALTGKGNIGIANMVAGMTALGYFSIQAKELAKGREPLEANSQTFLRAMLQGGAMGLYGDFLLAEHSRFGGGMAAAAIGPAFSELATLLETGGRVARAGLTDESYNPSKDLLRSIKSNTPLANLFYTKGAMDYLIWYRMQEMVNPGYLSRMERNLKNRTGQGYFVPPSSFVGSR